MVIITAVAIGVATGSAGYVAVEHINKSEKAWELEQILHLPDLPSWDPVAGMTQVREAPICCAEGPARPRGVAPDCLPARTRRRWACPGRRARRQIRTGCQVHLC